MMIQKCCFCMSLRHLFYIFGVNHRDDTKMLLLYVIATFVYIFGVNHRDDTKMLLLYVIATFVYIFGVNHRDDTKMLLLYVIATLQGRGSRITIMFYLWTWQHRSCPDSHCRSRFTSTMTRHTKVTTAKEAIETFNLPALIALARGMDHSKTVYSLITKWYI